MAIGRAKLPREPPLTSVYEHRALIVLGLGDPASWSPDTFIGWATSCRSRASEIASNAAFDRLNKARNDRATIDVSAGNTTVSPEDFRRNVLLVLTGTPAAPLDLRWAGIGRLIVAPGGHVPDWRQEPLRGVSAGRVVMPEPLFADILRRSIACGRTLWPPRRMHSRAAPAAAQSRGWNVLGAAVRDLFQKFGLMVSKGILAEALGQLYHE